MGSGILLAQWTGGRQGCIEPEKPEAGMVGLIWGGVVVAMLGVAGLLACGVSAMQLLTWVGQVRMR